MQALGPIREGEEVTKLRELKIDNSDPQANGHMPIDEDSPLDKPTDSTPSQPFDTFQALHSTVDPNSAPEEEPLVGPTTVASEGTATESRRDPETLEEEHSLDVAVEEELRAWQVLGHPDEGAHDLWRRYSSLTDHLAHDLCEQLRLILEPTLATRLKGDYRTGKRLNMKKVIPYIASEFTKDKIWLRRTRPSKRDYQVLLALDDSKSMREGRAAHLAFETLSLVVKALSRLEAGDTSVVRFGETVDVLHDFDSGAGGAGFSDQDGAKVIQNFKFDQRATNVLSLLDQSLKVLADARARRSGGSADLWQLEIIVSDGICQDHEKLRSVLRRATEQRVMVVFVVIDALRHSTKTTSANPSSTTVANSILTMKQASYAMVSGKMELQMQRYLDSFPFEYFVVLRDVESLPDVLAGTLKQFFEKVSEE